MNPDELSDDQLVAFLHGELAPADRAAVARALRGDADARDRLAVLEQVDLALGEALERDTAPQHQHALAQWWRPLLGLAAAGVVVAAFVFVDRAATPPARNDHIELNIAPAGGASAPLFTDAAFELRWHNLDGADPRRQLEVHAFPFGTTLEALGTEVDRATHIGTLRSRVLPVVLSATIRGPDGLEFAARYAPIGNGTPLATRKERARQLVHLRDFEVESVRPMPWLTGRPADREWHDDEVWRLTNMPTQGPARWLPELPGTWTIALRVETPPAPDYMPWPVFAEPLTVESAIVMTGAMTDWGEAHDGIRARLCWSTGAATAETTPFALQLRNESGRMRRYNHVGTTIAKIPQPQHFTLLVDGEEWQQQDRVPLRIGDDDLMTPHPNGQWRSFVTRAGYWRKDGATLGTLSGKHRVSVLFHFEPSLWTGGDTTLWMGKVRTPDLEIDVLQPK